NTKTYLGSLLYADQSAAYGINSLGQVVGESAFFQATYERATLWKNANQPINLGVFYGGTSSCARDINDSGVVLGWSNSIVGMRAFRWKDDNNNGVSDPGEMKMLATTKTIDKESEARAINNLGDITGAMVNTLDGGWHAFRWSNGNLMDIGTLG